MNDVTRKLLSVLFILGAVFLAVVSYERIWKINLGPVPLPSQISVEGQGKVTVIPNIAETSFTVISEGLTPNQVQEENNRKMANAIEYLKKNGIAEKDIQTTSYYLNPKYYYPTDTRSMYPVVSSPTIVGYTLNQTITVKIRELARAGDLVAGVIEQGINQTSGISFTVDDDKLKEYQNEARTKAFAEAKSKAEAMSKAAGVRLGKVMTFSENFYGGPIPYYAKGLGMGGGGADMAVASAPIQAGSQDVSVSINITYLLK